MFLYSLLYYTSDLFCIGPIHNSIWFKCYIWYSGQFHELYVFAYTQFKTLFLPIVHQKIMSLNPPIKMNKWTHCWLSHCSGLMLVFFDQSLWTCSRKSIKIIHVKNNEYRSGPWSSSEGFLVLKKYSVHHVLRGKENNNKRKPLRTDQTYWQSCYPQTSLWSYSL